MFQAFFSSRCGHYAILIVVTAALMLPNLGANSLWDIDEALNSEASREMLERGTWIVPTFNFELRSAKPAMLNWMQMLSYQVFGVNEFGARIPSVLMGLLTVLLTYELARRMFTPITGLLSGIILTSAAEFCLLSHAATPDAPMLFFLVLSFTIFWFRSMNGSRKWWLPMSVACGLGVLTKGPVCVAMPAIVLILYFAWNRELSRLWDRKIITAFLVFLAVILPWYILVSVETRGAWIKDFLFRHNFGRFVSPMENHGGPILYHAIGLLFLYAPWCIFLFATIWHGVRQARVRPTTPHPEVDLTIEQTPNGVRAYRFLIVWFTTYLVFFSIAATKLPNYVLPLYPALAILTGRLLERWRLRVIESPRWLTAVSFTCLLLVGVVTFAGLKLASGAWKLPFGKMPSLEGVDAWASIGLVPVVTAMFAWWFYRRDERSGVLVSLSVGAAVYIGLLAGGGSLAFDEHKAPRALVAEAGAFQPDKEIRLGSLVYFQPSTVFYAQRQIERLESTKQASDFLSLPIPVYVFVEEKIWNGVKQQIVPTCEPIAKHWDLYKNGNVLVVWNGK